MDDYAIIALEAPKLRKEFIHQSSVHNNNIISQKNIMSGLAQVLEMDKIIYHAVTCADDNSMKFILSKQRASYQVWDKNTRNKTNIGENPKLAKYLIMVHFFVKQTTIESHGHTLGLIIHAM